MRYGIPYKGSKNRIARWVIDHLPPARTLVDLFAGGCAVTHAALLSGKYERVIANDINGMPGLFVEAVRGGAEGLRLDPRQGGVRPAQNRRSGARRLLQFRQ